MLLLLPQGLPQLLIAYLRGVLGRLDRDCAPVLLALGEGAVGLAVPAPAPTAAVFARINYYLLYRLVPPFVAVFVFVVVVIITIG